MNVPDCVAQSAELALKGMLMVALCGLAVAWGRGRRRQSLVFFLVGSVLARCRPPRLFSTRYNSTHAELDVIAVGRRLEGFAQARLAGSLALTDGLGFPDPDGQVVGALGVGEAFLQRMLGDESALARPGAIDEPGPRAVQYQFPALATGDVETRRRSAAQVEAGPEEFEGVGGVVADLDGRDYFGKARF